MQKREEQDQPRLALAELAGQHLVCKRVVPHEAPPGAPRQLDRARRDNSAALQPTHLAVAPGSEL